MLIILTPLSACYASKKDWKQAQQDAAQCVAKDPSFIKGYYRLATAQTELGLFDDAIATLTAGIAKEPGGWLDASSVSRPPSDQDHLYLSLYAENDQLAKQLKTVRSKKAAAVAKAKRPQRNLDEAQRKEVMYAYTYSYSYIYISYHYVCIYISYEIIIRASHIYCTLSSTRFAWLGCSCKSSRRTARSS
jgi:hypothetical protein